MLPNTLPLCLVFNMFVFSDKVFSSAGLSLKYLVGSAIDLAVAIVYGSLNGCFQIFTHSTYLVIISQIKHEGSLAIAVTDLFWLTPLLNVSL